MQHRTSLNDIELNNAWLSIGTFDGVHRGHQEIVKHLVKGAHEKNLPAVVITFFPHPAVVLGKRKEAYYLTSPEERAELLGKIGVDIVLTLPFNSQIAQLNAKEFMSRVNERIRFSVLVVGSDFALGRNREGNVHFLRELGRTFNYSILSIPSFYCEKQIVSSSRIRSLLLSGQVELVKSLLGRNYVISGKVIPGDGRGKLLKIPTANLKIWDEYAVPARGVYVSRANYLNYWWEAVTNIGIRPTFENSPVHSRIEAHLLDFSQDIYDEELKIEFIERIRPEKKFGSVNELLQQINLDIQTTREKLSKYAQLATSIQEER